MQNLNPNPRRRARLSRILGGIALINVLITGRTAPAAQAPPEQTGPVNRWLIIVDTSHGMEPRTESARQIAGILVLSGMNGQMHRGDTIGLWTFNQSLYAGTFPLQDYRPETARTTAQRIVAFLEEQPNEKSSHLEKVMPEVDKLIKGSEFITVVIISDGSSKIIGTPFDDKINETFNTWRTQQKKSNMPFITLLRARRGVLTDYMVNTPPWELVLPPLPAELTPAPKPAGVRLPPEAPNAPAGVRLPPESPKAPTASALIISGRTDSTPTSDPNIIVVTANSNTNLAANLANSSTVTHVVPTQPAKAPEPTPATPPGVVPVMAAEISKSSAPATTTAGSTSLPAPVATNLAAATSAAPTSSPTSVADNHAAARADDSSAKSAIPTPTAMGVFSGGIFSPRNLFIVVGFLIVIMIIMMVAKARQPQEPTRISLITRSLDQEQR